VKRWRVALYCRDCPTRRCARNPPLYPAWQEYFRKHQPPVLIAWGKNDKIFPVAGAEPYKRDLKTLEYHLLDAGHFALETNGDEIAALMRVLLGKHLTKK
jgi:pimeloyl-ACP methyl ester carboxylesterase